MRLLPVLVQPYSVSDAWHSILSLNETDFWIKNFHTLLTIRPINTTLHYTYVYHQRVHQNEGIYMQNFRTFPGLLFRPLHGGGDLCIYSQHGLALRGALYALGSAIPTTAVSFLDVWCHEPVASVCVEYWWRPSPPVSSPPLPSSSPFMLSASEPKTFFKSQLLVSEF